MKVKDKELYYFLKCYMINNKLKDINLKANISDYDTLTMNFNYE